jgi:hypothetical protein
MTPCSTPQAETEGAGAGERWSGVMAIEGTEAGAEHSGIDQHDVNRRGKTRIGRE